MLRHPPTPLGKHGPGQRKRQADGDPALRHSRVYAPHFEAECGPVAIPRPLGLCRNRLHLQRAHFSVIFGSRLKNCGQNTTSEGGWARTGLRVVVRGSCHWA